VSNDRQRRDTDLSRVYSEGAWPEPSRQIDEAILAASRRAARARHPILHRWGAPFALAATVVLGVTLALMVSEHESGRELKDFFRYSGPSAERSASGPKREAPPAAAKTEAAPKPDLEPKAEPAPAKRPAAPPAAAKSPASPAAQALRRADAPSDPERADRVRRELEQLEETRQARDAAPREFPAREPQSQTEAASLPGTVASGPAAGLRGASSAPAARAPEAWLDDIRKLRAAGRTPEAERELAEFRKRYPEYRLPDDLR
jgi:hypothetical protein